MTRLQLDYQRGARLFPWAGAGLLALALVASVWIGSYYRDLTGKVAYWEDRADKDNRLRQHDGSSMRPTGDMAAEIKYVNGVLAKLTLPWDKLFQAVEWSAGKDVALLGMEPDAEKREVKISAEAKNLMAMTRYLGQLSAQEIFTNVYLQSHQVQEQMAEKPVRFTLIAAWKMPP